MVVVVIVATMVVVGASVMEAYVCMCARASDAGCGDKRGREGEMKRGGRGWDGGG